MTSMPSGAIVRRVMLEVIAQSGESLQLNSILNETTRRLQAEYGQYPDQAILTLFYDLFRSGHLSWGYNLSNPQPPFCHVTVQGRRTLQHLSRDPANPDGYLAHLRSKASLTPRTEAYLSEALLSYNSSCLLACAVMIGCATESVLLELRDAIEARLQLLGASVPSGLTDWRAKRVLDTVREILDAQKGMPRDVREAFDAYWSAFSHIIRTIRNDAGHPSDLTTVTEDTVHATLLMFPELAALSQRLSEWANSELVSA